MSFAAPPLQSLAPPLPGGPDFLGRCASLGMALLARLQTLVQSPCAESPTSKAAYQQLDGASRILKRIQETYLSAQKAMFEREPQPARMQARAAAHASPGDPFVAAIAPERARPPIAIPPVYVLESSAATPGSSETALAPSPVAHCPANPIDHAMKTPSAAQSFPPPADAVDHLLASVAALEARYAAPSAESPLVARLVKQAKPPDPDIFKIALSPLCGASHTGSGTPAQSAAGKKGLIRHKPRKKR